MKIIAMTGRFPKPPACNTLFPGCFLQEPNPPGLALLACPCPETHLHREQLSPQLKLPGGALFRDIQYYHSVPASTEWEFQSPFPPPRGISISLFLHCSPQALTFWVPLLPSKVK